MGPEVYHWGMEHSLIKRAVALVSLAGAVYAGLVVASTADSGTHPAIADAGLCAVPSAAAADSHTEGPTYFVGCGGFF